MSTLHDQLAQIERHGAASFAGTALAHSHASVIRAVRRHRVARAAASTVAGVGVVGGAGWGAIALLGSDAELAPASMSSATASTSSVSPSPNPAPPSSAAQGPTSEFTVVAGWTSTQIAAALADAYGVSDDRALAALELSVETLVPEATTMEGWFADGQPDLAGALSVEDAADVLVTARVAELTELGVARADWQTVITKASLVEREAKLDVDRPKVARVIENRLAAGTPLQLDSTVLFVAPGDSVFTTVEQRATDSPYNTYLYLGLPPGAIATPSLESIQAVLFPAEGDWLFFVTVNLTTGETLFASTFEGHQENVQILQEWLAANP